MLLESLEAACPGLEFDLMLEPPGPGSRPGRLWGEDVERTPLASVPLRSVRGELLGVITVLAAAPPDRVRWTLIDSVGASAAAFVTAAKETEYRALIDRVPAILYIADPGVDGAFHYVSPQIETILGFAASDWIEDPTLWARNIHPDDRQDSLERERARSAAGLPDPMPVEYRMLHREDGHAVWIRDDALLLRDEEGRLRWHGVLSDITDRKLAELELERRVAQQAAVARLGEHALERVEVDELIEEALQAAVNLLDVEFGLVGELVTGSPAIRLRAAYGYSRSEVGRVYSVSDHGSQAGYTLHTGAPVVVEDWQNETRFNRSPLLAERGVRSGVCVQIEGRDAPFGVFQVASPHERTYSRGDVDFVQALANVLADALERRRTEAAIEHRALHDPLTGLPNRVLFLDRLQHALDRLRRRSPTLAAVLFIDLDHFKLVNDSLGHHAGDELLAAVATRLREVVRPSDTIARFGGDEFGLLLEEITSERDAIAMAERIAAVFARPFVLDSNEHFVTTSIGIALATGGEQSQDLIRDADAAMYRAKERGRARYELFDELMRARAIARLRTENDLRRALERSELKLAYQPVVTLADSSIVGVEALLRWDHPERGMIAPEEFIPVAEESGLIDRIGRWALDRACRDAVEWGRGRPDAAPIRMAVNLSPLQIASGGFEAALVEVLEKTGHDPSLLTFEITESLLLGHDETIDGTLQALKRLGVGLALDDFGTGYSSLSYLTRLPLDALKVDRSFVATLGTPISDSAITEAIVAMARALSLTVVAEGVETEAQAEELRRLGCSHAQGNLFSEPVAADRIAVLLRAAARPGPPASAR